MFYIIILANACFKYHLGVCSGNIIIITVIIINIITVVVVVVVIVIINFHIIIIIISDLWLCISKLMQSN